MPNSDDDLWPDDLTAEPTDRAPLTILREQAAKLGEKTGNLVEGRVITEAMPGGSSLSLRMILVAPALDGYEYVLLRATQPVDLYPVTLEFEGNVWIANDEIGFKQYLESLFKSAKTRKIISNLVAQSRGA